MTKFEDTVDRLINHVSVLTEDLEKYRQEIQVNEQFYMYVLFSV